LGSRVMESEEMACSWYIDEGERMQTLTAMISS
jgi:hypothetical protein